MKTFFIILFRPEQILYSLPQAINVMLDQSECGPATISLSQDVQGEAYDYPSIFFEERVRSPNQTPLNQQKRAKLL